MNYPAAGQWGIYKGIVTPQAAGELNPCPPLADQELLQNARKRPGWIADSNRLRFPYYF
jgi:hypothetical protein